MSRPSSWASSRATRSSSDGHDKARANWRRSGDVPSQSAFATDGLARPGHGDRPALAGSHGPHRPSGRGPRPSAGLPGASRSSTSRTASTCAIGPRPRRGPDSHSPRPSRPSSRSETISSSCPDWRRITPRRSATRAEIMPDRWRASSPGRIRSRPTGPTSGRASRSTRSPRDRSARPERLPSLELGIDPSAQAGSCDSGYSWPTRPTSPGSRRPCRWPRRSIPRLVFDRLFGAATGKGRPATGQAPSLRPEHPRLRPRRRPAAPRGWACNDRRKLDEYLTALREIEPDRPTARDGGRPRRRREFRRAGFPTTIASTPADARPHGARVPGRPDPDQHVHVRQRGEQPRLPLLGVPDGHHDLSHHGNDTEQTREDPEDQPLPRRQFAYLLEKLKSIREGEAPCSTTAMIVYGSGISDGDRHNHDDLPILLAGRGGGNQDRPARPLPSDTPLTNLYLSMLDRMGVNVDRSATAPAAFPARWIIRGGGPRARPADLRGVDTHCAIAECHRTRQACQELRPCPDVSLAGRAGRNLP